MSKLLKEIELRQDIKCRAIEKTAIEKDITFKDAEKLHENSIRDYAIGELAESLNISFKDAEKYHDSMVKMTKALIFKDALEMLEVALGK